MGALADALVSKGGYNPTDAANAEKGPRAAELSREFLGTSGSGGGSSGGGASYFDNYQNMLAGLFGSDITKNGPVTFDTIKSALQPDTPYPAALNRVDTFNAYRDQYGVTQMESQLNDLKAQEDALVAQTRINVAAEKGKVVPTNVIAGRVNEQQVNAQEQLDFIGRQKTRLNDQLTTAYNVIGMYMNFQTLDYNDAVTKYNTEFKQNLDTINLMQGIQGNAITQTQNDINNARANLAVYTNAITSGNLDPSKLTADQTTTLNKLEVQSGLPVGFVQSLQMSPKDKVLFTNTNNGITQVGIMGADGQVTVKSYGTATGGGGVTAAQKAQAISAMQTKLLQLGGSDYMVSPDEWKQQRAIWQQAGYSVQDFDNAFKNTFVNWQNGGTDYGFNVDKTPIVNYGQ